MTVGNATAVNAVANSPVMIAESIGSMVTQNIEFSDSNFQSDFMQAMKEVGQSDTSLEPASTVNKTKQNDNLKTSDDPYKDAYRKANDTTQKEDRKELSEESVSELKDEIKSTVKDALGLNDEELEEAMSELGLTVTDLLNPANVVELVANVNEVAPEQIIADETLSDQLGQILQNLDTLLADYSMDNQIPEDVILDTLIVSEEQEPTEAFNLMQDENAEDEEPEIEFVRDESTGREIKLTTKDHLTESEVSFTGDRERTEETSDSVLNKLMGKEEQKSSDSHGFGSGSEGPAQQFLQNLTQSLEETLNPSSNVTPYTTVNASDVIDQMINAVKVNVTNEIQSMEIQLNPESLGKLNLTVIAKDGMITASITAQNEAVKNALEAQLNSLKNDLNQAGLRVENVEVTVSEHAFDSNMMEQNGQNEAQDNAKGHGQRKFRGLDELEDEEARTTEAPILQDDSSINLTA